jgi:hypothetical protein
VTRRQDHACERLVITQVFQAVHKAVRNIHLQIVRQYPVPDSEEADIACIGVSFNYCEISMMQLLKVEESVYGGNLAALSRKTTSRPSRWLSNTVCKPLAPTPTMMTLILLL